MKRFFIFLIFIPGFLYGQDRFVADSLNLKLESASVDSMKIKILWNLSDLFKSIDFKKSLSYADSALMLAKKSDARLFQALSYKKKGEILYEIGLYHKSFENLLKSKSISDEIENSSLLIRVNQNIGVIRYMLAEYDEALKYFNEALTACNRVLDNGDSTFYRKIHIVYTSIGSVYERKGELDNALSYFNNALESAQKFKDFFELGVIYNNLGKLYQNMGNKEEALLCLKLSLENRERINDKNGMARSHTFLGRYYLGEGKILTALGAAENAMKEAMETGSFYAISEASLLLYEINKKRGDDSAALEAFLNYHSYNDTIYNEKSIKEITRLQMQFDFDKAEKIRQMGQRRKDLIFSLLVSTLILGVIILALFYALQKSKIKQVNILKQNIELKLENLNKKLTTNVMFLMKKNELIREISAKLIKLKTPLAAKYQMPVQKIIFELNSLTEEDTWEEFELRFQEVHRDFYESLNHKFPDLTPNERRLCAFLRLNLSTKDISAITQQTARSIEMARTRLRRKLDLTNTDVNLITFLSNL